MYAQTLCEKLLIWYQMDCWNEAAGLVDCDPNVDDECLCGTFFDEVAACTGTTCGIAENLGECKRCLDVFWTVANSCVRSYFGLYGAGLQLRDGRKSLGKTLGAMQCVRIAESIDTPM